MCPSIRAGSESYRGEIFQFLLIFSNFNKNLADSDNYLSKVSLSKDRVQLKTKNILH
jgi:hypothetical protein